MSTSAQQSSRENLKKIHGVENSADTVFGELSVWVSVCGLDLIWNRTVMWFLSPAEPKIGKFSPTIRGMSENRR